MVEFMQLADTQLGMQRHLSLQTMNNPEFRKERQQRWINNGFVPAGEAPNELHKMSRICKKKKITFRTR